MKKSRCVLLVHDVYPDLLVTVGKLKRGQIWTKFLYLASRTLYRSMDRIIVLGRDMQELIRSKLNKKKDRVIIANNWAELDTIWPQPKSNNRMSVELHLTNKFVALYAGNMGHPHNLEIIVQAAEKVRSFSDIHFLFIGSGAKKGWLENAIKVRKLRNVTIICNQPREDQQTFLNSSDIALISLVPGMKGISVPSRLYNILSSGRPIIAVVDPGSEVAMVLQEEHVGWAVVPGRSDQLIDAILYARANPSILEEMGQRARALAENNYSFDNIIPIYRGILESSLKMDARDMEIPFREI